MGKSDLIDVTVQLHHETDRLTDKIEGLEADLSSAVETAFKRGATEWTRLNYPDAFARLSTKEADHG